MNADESHILLQITILLRRKMIHRLRRIQLVSTPLEEIWSYFSTPKNLNTMTPPHMQFEIIYGDDERMFQGQLIEYRVQLMPMVTSRWLTEITHVQEQVSFVDEQRIGPYRFWHHTHHFDAIEGGTRITDQITYALPFEPFGDLVHHVWVRKQLKQIFDFLREKLQELFT